MKPMRSATRDRATPLRHEASDLDAARRLSDALANGGWLEPVAINGVSLEPGEAAFADLHASGWRYFALDQFAYERRTLLLGGPLLMALTGVVSAIGNSRRRRDAERAAAPQWRPLGPLRVVVTSRRLLVWFEQSWWSVWYSAIADVRAHSEHWSLDLYFHADAPYRFVGPQVPSLTVILSGGVVVREQADRVQ